MLSLPKHLACKVIQSIELPTHARCFGKLSMTVDYFVKWEIKNSYTRRTPMPVPPLPR